MNKKIVYLNVGLVALSLVLALAALPFLPPEITVQWDFSGQPSNVLGSWAVLLFPLAAAVSSIIIPNCFQNRMKISKGSPFIAAVVSAVMLACQLFIIGSALAWW